MEIQTNTNKSKYARLKGFLFFLVVATLFWMLTNFSNDKTGVVAIHLNYTDVPENTLLPQNLTKTARINATASGFQMLYYRLKKPTLDISLTTQQKDSTDVVIINENQLKELIGKQLKIKEVKSIVGGDVVINLDESTTKIIPIRLKSTISFKTGFRGLSSLQASTDSLLIEGPSEVLSNITEIFTKPIIKNNVSNTFSEEVALELPNKEIRYNLKKITVSLEVKEFTEKQLTLPINVVNIPANSTLKTIPETLVVTFEVMVAQFGEVSETDFKVVCDYLERIEDNNVMIPKIVTQPETIFNVHLSARKVDYLIFK